MHRLPALLSLLTFLLPATLLAQTGEYTLGARSHALAGSSVTISDGWSVFNNVGAMGNLESSSVMATYQNRYNVSGFRVVGGGAVYKHKLGSIGAKFVRFGDEYYNQQQAGLALSNRFQMVSFGVGVNLQQVRAESLRTKSQVTLEMGGTAELTEHIVLGAHIFNFRNGDYYPTTMKAGLSLRPTTSLMINAEVEKQLDTHEMIKAGLEYFLIKSVCVRTGLDVQRNDISDTSVSGNFGLGILLKSLVFDYAFSSQTLGAIHEVSLAYQIKESK